MAYSGRLPLYGLDIETDTSDDGLDPGVAAVVAAALSSSDGGELVLTGGEAGILVTLDRALADAPAGVVVTWNGGAFDLPFLAARAAALGLELGLELHWDPAAYRPGRRPLPGALGTYSAGWYGHAHVDAYRAWRTLVEPEQSCALKVLAESLGLDAEVEDASQIHVLPPDRLRRYVASDAAVTRRLAELRWRDVRRFVDRLPAGGQLAFG